jgi:hypothetical protein
MYWIAMVASSIWRKDWLSSSPRALTSKFMVVSALAVVSLRKKIMPTEAAIKAIPTMNEIVVERILNRTDLTFIRVLAKKAQNKIL